MSVDPRVMSKDEISAQGVADDDAPQRGVEAGVVFAETVTKIERLEWKLHSDNENELQGPLKNAIMHQGVKDVQQLLRNGAPLIAEYFLETDDGPIGLGTTLDLVMLHKRFKLASQLLRPDFLKPAAPEDAPSESTASQAAAGATELGKSAVFSVAWAARDGRAEVLEALLGHGASPVQCDERGRSALLLAAMRGQKRCAELLLAAGAWELESSAKEEIRQWLTHFKIPLPAGIAPCDIETPHTLALRLGLIHEPEKSQQSASPIIEEWFANTPHGRLAWPLRPKTEDALQEGQGPLESAITGYGIKEVERILSCGAPLTAEYRLDAQGDDVGTALDLAMGCRRYNLAAKMLSGPEAGELARLSMRSVVWSARDGRLNILRELLRLGAPAGQCDETGRSALLLAAMRGHADCAAALLEANAWQYEGSCEEVLEWATRMKLPCFYTDE